MTRRRDPRRTGTELERVALLASRFAGAAEGVRVAIGDDAAILERPAGPLVWTIDAQVEGTHFRLDWLTWQDVGWRSFMAATSDLAAMGATPLGALSALTLPPSVDDGALDALAEGQAAASKACGCPIIGGNLARGTEVSVTTTVLGIAERPIERRGARPGEGVYLGGDVGLAAAGLALLMKGAAAGEAGEACVAAWRRPVARLALGLAARGRATAAIDVSDGLARDASHVAIASEVTIVLDETRLRAIASPALESVAVAAARDPLDLMLRGGEDYALVVTSPEPIEGFARIGDVERGAADVLLRSEDGSRAPVSRGGFDHFS